MKAETEENKEASIPRPDDAQPSDDLVFSTLTFGDDSLTPSNKKKQKKPIASLIKKVRRGTQHMYTTTISTHCV